LLKAKAVEEALEFYAEPDAGKAFEELADLLEVIDSACFVFDRSFDDLRLVAKAKREERGGFKEGVVLVETREVPLIGK
jgi:predicted house-cleaning noncanonical NTP pyrophosphatase (MazG superfamily)